MRPKELREAIELELAMRAAILRSSADLHEAAGTVGRRQIDPVHKMIALEPDEASWHGRLGELLLSANRLELAEAALRQAIALREDLVSFYHMMDIVLERQQKLVEAASVLRKAQTLRARGTWLEHASWAAVATLR